MNEQELQELLEGFQGVNYPKVNRNQQAYDQTEQFIEAEVARLLEMYRGLTTLDQRARLIRDGLDLYLRRGHGYSIEGNIGAHYRQIGARVEDCDFEHMIPQAKIRDALIQGRLTIRQAMNPPTCWLHKIYTSNSSRLVGPAAPPVYGTFSAATAWFSRPSTRLSMVHGYRIPMDVLSQTMLDFLTSDPERH